MLKIFYSDYLYFCYNSVIVFSVYKQNFTAQNLKTRTALIVKVSVFVICVEAIIYFLLYNLHDCTCKNIFQTAEHCNEKELGKEVFRIYEDFVYITFCVVTFN